MLYRFDNFGWYAGETTIDDPRRTEVAPTNLSQTTTPGELRSNFTGYQWVEVPYVAPVVYTPPTGPTPLHLHITLTDGDGIDPIGMLNDGVDAISISAAFRQATDPASAVLTMITGMWRVVIRDSDNLVYDIIGVNFINGVASFPYTTTNRPAICKLHESDLNALPIIIGETEYKIVLVNPVEFKIYRTLQ